MFFLFVLKILVYLVFEISIEGYRLSRELIEKVHAGSWKLDEEAKKHKNALAARGYSQVFQVVRQTISDILKGKNTGEAVKIDHSA